MTLDVPLEVRVAEWRKKEAEGTLSDEEMREAIRAIRAGRVSASQTSTRSRAAKAPVDVGNLLEKLSKL